MGMSHRVVIAGSGVAAVEAVLALRHLAPPDLAIELLAPAHALEDRPASVATAFGLAAPAPLDLHDLARRYAVELVEGELATVDVDRRIAQPASGAERPYDHLLVAVGATAESAIPGSLVFGGPTFAAGRATATSPAPTTSPSPSPTRAARRRRRYRAATG